ncbi:MAG: CDP-alcohol phosphatidyltransferase family protein, partial [Cellulomonas sp.]|nr:CDP-alcohol phosphatidyltransferase family protein [Cellulomonas sp.]
MLHGLRGAMTRLFTPVARVLLRAGISPDAVTATGTLAVVVIGLWAFPTGHLLLGAVLIGLSALTDSLDGVMARQAGRSG